VKTLKLVPDVHELGLVCHDGYVFADGIDTRVDELYRERSSVSLSNV
jgi:hypothetical protein